MERVDCCPMSYASDAKLMAFLCWHSFAASTAFMRNILRRSLCAKAACSCFTSFDNIDGSMCRDVDCGDPGDSDR